MCGQASDLDSSTSLSASTHSYCSSDDATCASCRASWLVDYAASGSIPSNSTMCTGDGGCVCVAACADPEWSANIVSTRCAIFTSTFKRFMAGILVVSSCLVLLLAVWLALRRFTGQRYPTLAGLLQRLRGPDDQRRGGDEQQVVLSLSAWSSLRASLIEKEKAGGRRTRLTRAPSIVIRHEDVAVIDVVEHHVDEDEDHSVHGAVDQH